MVSAIRQSAYLRNDMQPAFNLHQRGIEYRTVTGGGVQLVELDAGDAMILQDPEGMQYGEILVFDEQGRPNLSLIGGGTGRSADATQLLFKINENSQAFNFVRSGLKKRKIDISTASAIGVFGRDSVVDSVVEFVATAKVYCIVSAPISGYPTYSELPTTDLDLYIKRTGVTEGINVEVLPDPLGDVVNEFRIKAGTVQDYELKEGQYVQIVDVSGRQCSDFQAFDLKRLDKGVESMVSATATRANMHHVSPLPGLHSRYYNDDNERMLQLVQDTVGRHDTILVACSSKYYDDRGFPGHVNCSDNMSEVGKKYGIRSRKAWEAINFFFNTNGDHHAGITTDETWSRPGDYILMQASRDLMCMTSSCPDDLDPANGWNPTDIHVRIYEEKEMFKTAMGYRPTAKGKMRMTKHTGFYSKTSQLTENFIELAGYWLPAEYNNSSAREEYLNVRNNVGVLDLSSLQKFEILGPDAETLCQKVFTRNMKKLGPGSVAYTAICYDHGGMLDDGILFRMCPDTFRFSGGCPTSGIWLREKAKELGLKVTVKDSTEALCNIAVQGPNSRKLLKKIVWTAVHDTPLEDLGCFKFSPARLNNDTGTPIIASRTGYTGELGFEIWCAPKDADEIWDTVFETGAEFDVKPFGLNALDLLRIEAGLIFGGQEFDDTVDPFEAGIAFAVPLKSQEDDFIGRTAIERRVASPQRVLMGLEIEGNEEAVLGDCVRVGRAQVGTVTSAMRSQVLNKNIAMVRIDVEHAELGSEVEVGKLDGQQKRLKAIVVEKPFYDPSRLRMRQHKDDD